MRRLHDRRWQAGEIRAEATSEAKGFDIAYSTALVFNSLPMVRCFVSV